LHSQPVTLRVATAADIPTLNALIERSARELSRGFYTEQEADAAIRYVFGVDSALVGDGTYFVAEAGGLLAGCGGWSRRRTLYGGDQRPVGGSEWLDPATDAAKIRAFFVAPEYARRGIGRALLDHCAREAAAAGFTTLELMSTLPGVPLYEACGFARVRNVTDVLPNGVAIRFVLMARPSESDTR
jgi:GNAT superfamily N-acetyltransferase